MIIGLGSASQLQYAAHHSVVEAQSSKDDVLRCLAVLQYLTPTAQMHKITQKEIIESLDSGCCHSYEICNFTYN